MFLVIECRELEDQYECDCDRTPRCITLDYPDEYGYGFEIYKADGGGGLTRVKSYMEHREGQLKLDWGFPDDDDDGDDWDLRDDEEEDDEYEEFDESEDNATIPPVIREPIDDNHIRVVIGNSFERRSLDVFPERTLKDVITESEVDFSECGPLVLNGARLGFKDLEHSFDDFGIKPGSLCCIMAFRISKNACLAEGVWI